VASDSIKGTSRRLFVSWPGLLRYNSSKYRNKLFTLTQVHNYLPGLGDMKVQ
jgi:hypothetical protein